MTSFSINNSRDIICDKLFLLDTNNVLQSALDLIDAGGGGGSGGGITTLTGSGAAVITGTSTSKNIQVDLSMFSTTTAINNMLNNYTTTSNLNTLLNGKISTTHESYKIGSNNINFGAYNSTMETLTLQNSSGVTAVLSVDLGGNLNTGADGVITVPILNAWSYTTLKLKDSAGTIRNITSNLTGGLLYNNIQLATLTDLNNFTTTAGLNTLLSAYTNTTGLNT